MVMKIFSPDRIGIVPKVMTQSNGKAKAITVQEVSSLGV
jgi:hypothetical protein